MARRLGTVSALAIAGWLIAGPMAAQADTAPNASFSEVAAKAAADAQAASAEVTESMRSTAQGGANARAAANSVPWRVRSDGAAAADGLGSRGKSDASESAPGPDDIVNDLEASLSDPILKIVGPSSSHGLSIQEGDAPFPLPFDALLGDPSTKAVLAGESRFSKSKAKASLSGADPHPFLRHAMNEVNHFRAPRVDSLYGSSVSASDRMRGMCAYEKSSSPSQSSRRVVTPAEANDVASSACADDGEDDQPADPALWSVNAVTRQLFFWYVPASGTNAMAFRANPDEPSFSPD